MKIVKYQYNNYNVNKNNEKLQITLLEGGLPSIDNFFNFSIFALKTVIFPKSVFIDYDDNKDIWTFGENIRIIAGN